MATAKELGTQIEAKQQELNAWITPKMTPDGPDFQGDDLTAFRQRNEELKSLRADYDARVEAEKELKQHADHVKSMSEIRRRPIYTGGNSQQSSIKSLGEQFVDSAEYKNYGGSQKYEVNISGDAMKAILTADVLPYPAQQPGVVGYPTRRPVVADLIPQTDTDQPAIVYLEQTTQTYAADTVAEGATKPESDFSWTRREVAFQVIAHWAKISLQSLEDVNGIRDILNQEMVLGLQLAEEDQILTGTGTSPDLQGFLTKTGVLTQAKGSDDIFTAFMKALTKIRFTGRATPDGAVFHPNDWQTLVTYQDTTGRFIFGDPAAMMQNQTVWGIRSIVTDAITENTALIGAFQTYSRLWRKGGIRSLVDMTGDDLIKNLRTILVEERAALQITRPAAFCTLTGI